MLIIVYEMIMIPFRLAFTNESNYNTFAIIDLTFDSIFMLDILLNFNIAVYLRGFVFLLICFKSKEI